MKSEMLKMRESVIVKMDPKAKYSVYPSRCKSDSPDCFLETKNQVLTNGTTLDYFGEACNITKGEN